MSKLTHKQRIAQIYPVRPEDKGPNSTHLSSFVYYCQSRPAKLAKVVPYLEQIILKDKDANKTEYDTPLSFYFHLSSIVYRLSSPSSLVSSLVFLLTPKPVSPTCSLSSLLSSLLSLLLCALSFGVVIFSSCPDHLLVPFSHADVSLRWNQLISHVLVGVFILDALAKECGPNLSFFVEPLMTTVSELLATGNIQYVEAVTGTVSTPDSQF